MASYKWSDINDPPTLDPNGNTSYATKNIATAVYSRLFKVDAQPGKNPFEQPVVPDLAESAETTDGQHWVVKLRKGVKFHNKAPVNGREVTTEDVLASWKLLTAKTSTSASAVSDFTKVEAVDNYTMKFAMKSPSPIFLETLADASIFFVVPKEADGGSVNLKTTTIGSGPWILDSYDTSVGSSTAGTPTTTSRTSPTSTGTR